LKKYRGGPPDKEKASQNKKTKSKVNKTQKTSGPRRLMGGGGWKNFEEGRVNFCRDEENHGCTQAVFCERGGGRGGGRREPPTQRPKLAVTN